MLAILLGLVCAIAVRTSATIDQPRETQLWKSRAYSWLWEIVRRAGCRRTFGRYHDRGTGGCHGSAAAGVRRSA